MLEITHSNIQEVKKILSDSTVILYGAGTFGIQSINILKRKGIGADLFVDDDVNKQGTIVEGLPVLSYAELEEMSKQRLIHVILTSIYTRPILAKLEPLNIPVYQMYSLFIDEGETCIDKLFSMKQSQHEWDNKYNIIERALEDELSKKIWKHLGYVSKSKDLKIENFLEIASAEEHYFVSPIPRLLKEQSVLVDCGAYTGDMMSQLMALHIPFGKLYEIEANPALTDTISKNIIKQGCQDKVEVLCCGVFDKVGEMSFSVGENSAIGCLSTGGGREDKVVPINKLDMMFVNRKIDFLKMDIEGAELPALKGGEHLLLESRPILAISIYHTLDDLVDIPLYLMTLLEQYTFFIRHHSFSVGETVLYGIPKERI